MFGQPCSLTSNSNLLPLAWTHVINPDDTKKDHCVSNGKPRQKVTVTLVKTCTSSLKYSGSRIFWDLASLTGYQVHGADATHKFSGAPPPIAPFLFTIDEQCRNWNNDNNNA